MSAVPDWGNPRPWKAEPMDPRRPESFWEVLCGSRARKGGWVPMISHLTEEDAKDIAAAGAVKGSQP